MTKSKLGIELEKEENGHFAKGYVPWNKGKSGKELPYFKGTNEFSARRIARRIIQNSGINLNECQICKATNKKMIVHHKNNNPFDNSLDNLMNVCTICHNHIHECPNKIKNRFQKGHKVPEEWRERFRQSSTINMLKKLELTQ